ncbi:hypothetical protein ACLB2K_071014 [Fragaria x ananassa]
MKEHDSSSSAETVANVEELLIEILLCMPAGTLTRFKRVSKHWLSLISSPSFRNSHAMRVHNKTLYICTSETHDHRLHRYRVQAIKVSKLFSFSDTATRITVYSSKSKSKSKSNVLREVAFVDDNDDLVPACMGFGVFGSRIVLVGGWFEGPKFRYASKPSYVLDTSVSEPSLVSSVIPDMEEETINEPFLQEIDGKLYALSGKIFAVFDPKTNVWASLPPLPILNCSFHSCSVLGRKV